MRCGSGQAGPARQPRSLAEWARLAGPWQPASAKKRRVLPAWPANELLLPVPLLPSMSLTLSFTTCAAWPAAAAAAGSVTRGAEAEQQVLRQPLLRPWAAPCPLRCGPAPATGTSAPGAVRAHQEAQKRKGQGGLGFWQPSSPAPVQGALQGRQARSKAPPAMEAKRWVAPRARAGWGPAEAALARLVAARRSMVGV